jgi:tetratricopeptide (TPR) repeat protein
MGWFAKWAVLPRMSTLTRRANDAVSRRDWIAAASAYEVMVARQSHRADLRIQLGHCLKEAGKGDQADLAYGHAAQVAPEGSFDKIDAMFHLGLLRLQQGHRDRAILALGQVLHSDPAHTAALDALWHARLLTGLPKETLAKLRAVTAGEVAACHERLAQAQARLLAVERYPGHDYTSFRPAMTLVPPAGRQSMSI